MKDKRSTLTDGAGMSRPAPDDKEQLVYNTPMEAAGLTDRVIETLKRQHGKLHLVEVAGETDDDSPLYFVLRQPDRKVMAAAAKLGHSDPFEAGSIIIRNCLVWGNADLLDDMSVFAAVSEQFERVNKARAASIKNL